MLRVALWNASALPNPGDRLIDFVLRKELSDRINDVSFHTFSPWADGRSNLSIGRDGLWDQHQGEFDAIVIGGGAIITGPPFYSPAEQFFLLGPYPEKFACRSEERRVGKECRSR